ncbi:MAG: PocR ligand-binding domain-containing protein, partial [Acidobacteria bacterium]|nr:PocR ligand-binding domain-containing protein [Acidobacteriota bacterium]
MSSNEENPVRSAIQKIAEEGGVSVSIVDEASRQISVFNNNSICGMLNPGTDFSPDCARFCGRAFAAATDAGGPFGYECHAGLECVALPLTGTT